MFFADAWTAMVPETQIDPPPTEGWMVGVEKPTVFGGLIGTAVEMLAIRRDSVLDRMTVISVGILRCRFVVIEQIACEGTERR
jgi:hypothetical protein